MGVVQDGNAVGNQTILPDLNFLVCGNDKIIPDGGAGSDLDPGLPVAERQIEPAAPPQADAVAQLKVAHVAQRPFDAGTHANSRAGAQAKQTRLQEPEKTEQLVPEPEQVAQ